MAAGSSGLDQSGPSKASRLAGSVSDGADSAQGLKMARTIATSTAVGDTIGGKIS